MSAAKDLVVTCLGRVCEEGLPFEKDIVFRKAHEVAPRLRVCVPPLNNLLEARYDGRSKSKRHQEGDQKEQEIEISKYSNFVVRA